MKKASLAAALIVSAIAAQAQTAFNGNYGQTFNTLPTNSAPWVNNTTIPGWFLYGDSNNLASSPATLQILPTDPEINNTRGAFSVTDRAIALRPVPSQVRPSFIPVITLGLVNNSGSPVSQLLIEYTGEQYGFNFNTSGGLEFSYGIGNPDALTGGFIGVPTLSFSGMSTTNVPNLGTGYAETAVSDTLTLNTTWGVGQTLWLRWAAVSFASSGAFSAVDGLAINAINIPEPASAAALLFSLAGAGFGSRRRKR